MKSYIHVHTQMLSISPDLLKLDSDLIECLSDNGNEDILHLQYHQIRGQFHVTWQVLRNHHPGKEENHGDKVERGLPGVQTVSGPGQFLDCLDFLSIKISALILPVHDVDPALLRGGLVHSEHTGRELPKPGEANVKPGIYAMVFLRYY